MAAGTLTFVANPATGSGQSTSGTLQFVATSPAGSSDSGTLTFVATAPPVIVATSGTLTFTATQANTTAVRYHRVAGVWKPTLRYHRVAGVWKIIDGVQSGGGSTATAPSAPTTVTRTSTTTTATVNWQPPSYNGGSVITGYVVTATISNDAYADSYVPATATLAATVRTYTFTGLLSGTDYTLTVAAINAVGSGDPVSGTITTAGG